MFSQSSQLPDEEPHKSFQNNPRRHRKKPFKNIRKRWKRKNIRKENVQPLFTTVTMSSWAESFTNAATWQLKQQIAYWKSKATALEYENGLLHDIIRKNYLSNSQRSTNLDNFSDNEEVTETVEEYQTSEDDEENDNFEVSEEFIQFLMQNTKYKEDAKRERERLRALNDTELKLVEDMEAMPIKSTENKQEVLQNLYGENWQRIAALETSIHSQFINNCDQDKPEYWPNIPLNFNFN